MWPCGWAAASGKAVGPVPKRLDPPSPSGGLDDNRPKPAPDPVPYNENGAAAVSDEPAAGGVAGDGPVGELLESGDDIDATADEAPVDSTAEVVAAIGRAPVTGPPLVARAVGPMAGEGATIPAGPLPLPRPERRPFFLPPVRKGSAATGAGVNKRMVCGGPAGAPAASRRCLYSANCA